MNFSKKKWPIIGQIKKIRNENISRRWYQGIDIPFFLDNGLVMQLISYFLEDYSRALKPVYYSKEVFDFCNMKPSPFRKITQENMLSALNAASSGIILYSQNHTIYYKITPPNDINGPIKFAYVIVGDGDCIEEAFSLGPIYIQGMGGEFHLKPTSEMAPHCLAVDPHALLLMIMRLVFFQELSEVEEKLIKTGAKTRGRSKDGGKNEISVTVVGSDWAKTIIRDKEFGVRGHFALRACGKDRKDRRLVWINPYKKGGYKRTARINE